MNIMTFLRKPFLEKNRRETASAFLFKLFLIDLFFFFFWCVSDLAQRNAFSFADF